MRTIIDGAVMLGRATAHEELRRALELPEYYGANLDALWDIASTTDAQLIMIHPAPMLNVLGGYGCKIIQTLFEAADENPGFSFRVERGYVLVVINRKEV